MSVCCSSGKTSLFMYFPDGKIISINLSVCRMEFPDFDVQFFTLSKTGRRLNLGGSDRQEVKMTLPALALVNSGSFLFRSEFLKWLVSAEKLNYVCCMHIMLM